MRSILEEKGGKCMISKGINKVEKDSERKARVRKEIPVLLATSPTQCTVFALSHSHPRQSLRPGAAPASQRVCATLRHASPLPILHPILLCTPLTPAPVPALPHTNTQTSALGQHPLHTHLPLPPAARASSAPRPRNVSAPQRVRTRSSACADTPPLASWCSDNGQGGRARALG
jgi:hypothetical protein